MDSAFLYNYSRAGSVAPVAVPGGYDAGQWKAADLVALAPNLPGLSLLTDKVTALKVKGPLGYEVDDEHEFVQGIYTFEAGGGAKETLPENTCLVIGGFYNKGAAPTYYRVDFIDDADAYLALLRNHSYNVVIQSVSGEGYPTKEGAFNNKPSNIKAEVLDWNEKALPGIVFDEVNYLAASQTEFLLQGTAKTGNRFSVKSSIAWTPSVTFAGGGDPWITGLSGSFSGAGNMDDIVFNVTPNDTGGDRTGYIHVTAGRLDFVVTVIQRYAVDVDAWITEVSGASSIPGLSFSSASGEQPDARMFLLNWYPANAGITASIAGNFAFDDGSDKPGTAGNTTITTPAGAEKMVMTIRPKALTETEVKNTPFLERTSTVTFTAAANDKTETVTLLLTHVNHAIVATGGTYALDANSLHSFTVKSNVAWKILVESDEHGILDPASAAALAVTTGGPDTDPGVTVSFRLVSAESKDGKTATLLLVDPDGQAAVARVIIKGMACGMDGTPVTKPVGNNSYMTHLYDGKCWMVENSREGAGYSGVAFGWKEENETIGYIKDGYTSFEGRENGYYYTWTQANTLHNACPADWHLPTDSEFNALRTALNSSNNTWWNAASSRAGAYQIGDPGMWYNYENQGWWWGASATNRIYSSAGTGLIGPNAEPGYWFSVRCVQD
jgi:uncharacterized protein (TIGR02145 family)